QRHLTRLRELHREPAGSEITPELLSEQQLNIGLVIYHQYKKFHKPPPDFPSDAADRGKTILNSVYSPGFVSTSIDPPCCLTTMSWLSDRPKPVPSPAGFVVKNGLKILSFTSGGMPVPLSRIRISTLSPKLLVAAVMVGS